MTLDCPGMAANTPCRPDETLKRCMVCGFVVDTRYAAEVPAKERGPQEMTDAQIKHMVGRFLGWRPCYPGEKGSYTFFQNMDDPLDAPMRGMNFVCPGCGKVIGVRFIGDRPGSGLWRWDGNRDAPTLRPSIIHRDCGWHGYLTAGKWIDFDDSVQCDSCGEIVPRDEIAHVVAYGIETNACDKCRGG